MRLRDERERLFKRAQKLEMVLRSMAQKSRLYVEQVLSVLVSKKEQQSPADQLELDHCVLFTKVFPEQAKWKRERKRIRRIQAGLRINRVYSHQMFLSGRERPPKSAIQCLPGWKRALKKNKVFRSERVVQKMPVWGLPLRPKPEIFQKPPSIFKNEIIAREQINSKKRILCCDSLKMSFSYSPHNLFGPKFAKKRDLEETSEYESIQNEAESLRGKVAGSDMSQVSQKWDQSDTLRERLMFLLQENTQLKLQLIELGKQGRVRESREPTWEQPIEGAEDGSRTEESGPSDSQKNPLDSFLVPAKPLQVAHNFDFSQSIRPKIDRENQTEGNSLLWATRAGVAEENNSTETRKSTRTCHEEQLEIDHQFSFLKQKEKVASKMNLFGSEKLKKSNPETERKPEDQSTADFVDSKQTNSAQTLEIVQNQSRKSLISSLKKQLNSLRAENCKIRRVCKRIKKKKNLYRRKLRILEKEILELNEGYEEEIINLRAQLKIFTVKKALFFTHLFEENETSLLVKAKEMFN